jgi:hypothetical protein
MLYNILYKKTDTMKRHTILLISLFVLVFTGLKAQEDGKFVNMIQNQRIAFYTQKLGLTPEEAQKFWPVYNEYSRKKDLLGSDKKKLINFYNNNSATMTENDIDVTIKKYVQIVKDETSLFENYNKKFRSILPASKVLKLYLAENQFKEWLLKEIKMRENKMN